MRVNVRSRSVSFLVLLGSLGAGLPGNSSASWIGKATHAIGHAGSVVVHTAAQPFVAVAHVVTHPSEVAPLELVGVIATGPQSYQGVRTAEGKSAAAVANAVAETNAKVNNAMVVAAHAIGGNAAQGVVTTITGPNRYMVDFATMPVITAGGILSGQESLSDIVGAPLGTALHSAEMEYEDQGKPLPPDVRAHLAPFFDAKILDNALFVVGTVPKISMSVPAGVIYYQDEFRHNQFYAVTVGRVTVFSEDPGDDYHWWAHEMFHHVQYDQLGWDGFAKSYLSSCSQIEGNAEGFAQKSFPDTPWDWSNPCPACMH